jgi:REP element-mobilizing transposase RayT
MPDHAHLLARGRTEESRCKAFIKAAKQYSGFYFKQKHHHDLWQRYGYERVVRDDMERALVIGYIVTNPVEAGLVDHPAAYPFLGSERYTIDELLQICEYKGESSA